MEPLVKSRSLGKSYGHFRALRGVDIDLQPGQVLGLLGHNGAGKSTLIKSLLGAHSYDGELSVLGMEPQKNRVAIVQQLAYISDVAVLPEWMTVKQIINYIAGVHARFQQEKVNGYLAETDIQLKTKIGRLSKGMKVQLHLALVLATDVKVLVLDEPTLGLDLMFRTKFYQQLLDWFNQGDKALIIASHEVNEIASLLTDVLILRKGAPVVSGSIDSVIERYNKVAVPEVKMKQAYSARPLQVLEAVNHSTCIFDNMKEDKLASLGEVTKPTLAEIFVAVQQES
ncbi:ABC transporter ATP-binding protein [Photobacterium sanctipauli]|uniref:ABC transporter ATP-binding protein n=1 Tax=Photobacterium sanctipauli TaxID=1342794 RepID=A0A2T3NZ03_9GAMM|nr:ABC transporter ATP-binding protein [Photobacterium sanctipauli]PSW21448.1 ABC transporter ATP-binding protein [Photobacterium sanctipauli]